jgi:hypothetical protein
MSIPDWALLFEGIILTSSYYRTDERYLMMVQAVWIGAERKATT